MYMEATGLQPLFATSLAKVSWCLRSLETDYYKVA